MKPTALNLTLFARVLSASIAVAGFTICLARAEARADSPSADPNEHIRRIENAVLQVQLGEGDASLGVSLEEMKGTQVAIRTYHHLKKSGLPPLTPDRETLNSLAYWLLRENKRQDALEVAKLAAQEYPDYWNALDTLGEMYMLAGDKPRAIENYNKSLALNPRNWGGLAMLKQLSDAPKETQPGAKAGKTVYICPPCGLDCDKEAFDKPGVCPHCGMTLIEKSAVHPAPAKKVSVAILLFDGVEIIDYSGPWEIFGAAGFEVHTVATSGPIKTGFGQNVIPDYTLQNCPKTDILLVPGGNIYSASNDARLIGWIRNRSQESQHVISVCNGAFFLAKAGLLDGLSSTTIRHSLDRLAKVAPKTKVVRDRRYVDNGKIITTAGLSAGMDGALHLVSKIRSREVARSIASGLEYRWQSEDE